MKNFYSFASTLLIACFMGCINISNAQTWQSVGGAGFSSTESYYASIAFSPAGELHIFVSGQTNSATVMKYNGTSWETVGQAGFFNGGSESGGSMAFSPEGEIYVAVRGYGGVNNGRASVMKYDGSEWVFVGPSNFSDEAIGNMHLKFSNSGEPYVAYKNVTNPQKAIVKKFDGTNWVDVGPAGGLSAGNANGLSFAFSPVGEPHVSYSDVTNSSKATVKKFDGSSWTTVGTPGGISVGSEQNTSIAFSPAGELYVSYQDVGTNFSFNATVIKFNGTSWSAVGPTAFTPGGIGVTASLAFNPQGEPFVAFRDSHNGGKASVMKFNGTDWVYVGNQGFSEALAEYVTLLFDDAGNPYVAYQDDFHDDKASVMTLSLPTDIDDIIIESRVSLYPNPANNVLNIKTEERIKTIDIYNALGALVQTETRKSFAIDHLPAGVYNVHISTDKAEHTEKLIVR